MFIIFWLSEIVDICKFEWCVQQTALFEMNNDLLV